ncbi:MucBP domain-containing protein [Isobaculum melis]|uniref:LPXTG-motif cell wall anchor domain-containing protein n=1 Tax=Isobaculum melis TaxID=142588 RepID=A0A1H9S0R5_9LACT|nr:MucBP domain-containing protein [Isobaculum melis]SER78620.1 LPXTG-motif cell wall anchor domain-containing protein [Isobaculum melis]
MTSKIKWKYVGYLVAIGIFIFSSFSTIEAKESPNRTASAKEELFEKDLLQAYLASAHTYTSLPKKNLLLEKQMVPYNDTGVAGGNITIKYQDEGGNTLAKETILKENIGVSYQTEPIEIENYEITKTPDGATGTFQAEAQTVIYTYRLKRGGEITVEYIDVEGNVVSKNKRLIGSITGYYQVSPNKIAGYRLVNSPANAKGYFTKDPQTVTFIYEKETIGHVWVTYQTAAGQEIEEKALVRGEIGTPYETEAKEIAGYRLLTKPNNATGTFQADAQHVSYQYEEIQYGDVIVKYQDTAGKQLMEPVALTGELGTPYESAMQEFRGYRLTTTPENAKGMFKVNQQEVTYIYAQIIAGDVIVHYQDTAGKTIAEDEVLKGKFDAPYTAEAKPVYGYQLLTEPTNQTGFFTENIQEVTYLYEPIKAGDVTIHYQDTTGKALKEDQILNGYVNQPYTTTATDITGYRLIATPENEKGLFKVEAQTVLYLYEINPSAGVLVHYQDLTGKQLAADILLEGGIDLPYEATALPIADYHLVETLGEAVGTFTDTLQEVTYRYEKDLVQAADVVIHYQDMNGRLLQEEVILSGYVGEPYESEVKAFPNYVLTSLPENRAGTFGTTPQAVTYQYTQLMGHTLVTYQTDKGQVLATEPLTGQVGEPFVTTARDFQGYQLIQAPMIAEGSFTNSLQHFIYLYQKEVPSEQVVVKYHNQLGETIAEETLLEGELGTQYTTQPKDIAGYQLYHVEGSEQGFYQSEAQTVIYIYAEATSEQPKPSIDEPSTIAQLPATGEQKTHWLFFAGIFLLGISWFMKKRNVSESK